MTQAIVNLTAPPVTDAPAGHNEAMEKRFDDGAAAAARGEQYVPPAAPDVNAPAPVDTPAVTEDKPTDAPQDAAAAAPNDAPAVTTNDDPFDAPLAKAGLSMADVSKEFAEGGLSDATYQKLTDAGFPRDLVDLAIAGRQAEVTAYRDSIYSAAGSNEAEYADLVAWAGQNMTESEIDAYNDALNSGDLKRASLAASGLKARFAVANPAEPTFVENTKQTSGTVGYDNWSQAKADMAKPEYKKDPAFRAQVAARLAVSPNL